MVLTMVWHEYVMFRALNISLRAHRASYRKCSPTHPASFLEHPTKVSGWPLSCLIKKGECEKVVYKKKIFILNLNSTNKIWRPERTLPKKKSVLACESHLLYFQEVW